MSSPEPAASPSPKPDISDNEASVKENHIEKSLPKHDGKKEDDSEEDEDTEAVEDKPTTTAEFGTTSTSTSPSVSASQNPSSGIALATASAGDWQAVWSPAHNAYYFYNTLTQETTWVNPLQQDASSSAAASAAPSGSSPEAQAADGAGPGNANVETPAAPGSLASMYAMQAAAEAQGIDPSLAYLDPSLAAGPSNPAAFTHTAKFNSRTGAFARPDGRDPSHLSEYERAKRMSEAYFDVGEWEKQVAERKAEEEEEEGKKRKRPTKKDLERFKEQKRQKKIAKTAWLRT